LFGKAEGFRSFCHAASISCRIAFYNTHLGNIILHCMKEVAFLLAKIDVSLPIKLCCKETSPCFSGEVLVFDFRPLTCLYSLTYILVKYAPPRWESVTPHKAMPALFAFVKNDAAKERVSRSAGGTRSAPFLASH
jgi:hypothetical protein